MDDAGLLGYMPHHLEPVYPHFQTSKVRTPSRLVKGAKMALECTSRGVLRARVLKITCPAVPRQLYHFWNPREWVFAVVGSNGAPVPGRLPGTDKTVPGPVCVTGA